MDMSGSCSVQQHSSDGRLGSSWASFVQRNRASLTWPQGQGMPASQPQSPTSHSDNSHSLSPMAARQMPSSARCLLVQMMEAPGQMARRAPWPTQGQRLPLGMKHETFLSARDRAASLDASGSGCASPRLNPGAATCPEQQAAAGPSTRQRFVAQLTINTSCTAAQPSTALRMGSGDSASCPCSPATKHEPGQLTAQQDGDAAGAASAAIAKLHKMQQSLGRGELEDESVVRHCCGVQRKCQAAADAGVSRCRVIPVYRNAKHEGAVLLDVWSCQSGSQLATPRDSYSNLKAEEAAVLLATLQPIRHAAGHQTALEPPCSCTTP